MQTYDVTITVLSPLHIGSGDQPGRKSRWLAEGRVWLVDEQALFQQLADTPHLIDRFERFSLDRGERLSNFLKAAHIDPASVALYGIRCVGGRPHRYYLSHIKVPGRPPRPYIPGSSLKGALRSALLRSHIIANKGMRKRAEGLVHRQMRGGRPSRKRADDALEQEVFGRDQHHEWTRLFQVADTAPAAIEDLWATEVRVLSLRGNKGHYRLEEKKLRGGRPLKLFPEVLRPFAKLHTRLTLLDEWLSPLASDELNFPGHYGDVAELLKACNRTARDHLIQEVSFAQQTHWELGRRYYGWLVDKLEEAMAQDACLLRLGWGAGYDDKTVTDLLDDGTFREVLDRYRLRVGRPHRDLGTPPLDKPFAPKSRHVAMDHKGRWLPLGWVLLKLEAA
jgi:CRISPR-associated protein Csm5